VLVDSGGKPPHSKGVFDESSRVAGSASGDIVVAATHVLKSG
jgi:hypothetical protein